jgi:hypothetical protein
MSHFDLTRIAISTRGWLRQIHQWERKRPANAVYRACCHHIRFKRMVALVWELGCRQVRGASAGQPMLSARPLWSQKSPLANSSKIPSRSPDGYEAAMPARKHEPTASHLPKENRSLARLRRLAGEIAMVEPSGPANPQTLPPAALQALNSGQVPKFYANGAAIASTATDLTMILMDGPVPVLAAALTYTTAKSLAHDLDRAIKNYEEKTGDKVRQISELAPLFAPKK